MEPTPAIPQSFGELLRQRRMAAGLSQSEVARRTGLDRSTIYNIEEGKTEPAPATLRLLRGLSELALPAADAAPESIFEHDTWVGPLYDPLRIAADCTAMLNGPGGVLDQSYAYIDGAGAADWYAYSNADHYIARFRQRFPYEAITEAIRKRVKSGALDLVALGSGDGKTETRLAQCLTSTLPSPDLTLYLLDVSHPLLVTAFKHAVSTLQAPRVPVVPIHGNFNEVPRIWQLHAQPSGAERRRLWMLLGSTLGNLTHEPTLLGDLYACARPGDLFAVDFDLAWASARDLDAVRTADPALTSPLPELPARWLTGLIRRHCRGAHSVTIDIDVTNRCALSGAYELHFTATVKLTTGQTRRFLVFRGRRYDLAELQAAAKDFGWRCLLAQRFGSEPPTKAVLLLERC